MPAHGGASGTATVVEPPVEEPIDGGSDETRSLTDPVGRSGVGPGEPPRRLARGTSVGRYVILDQLGLGGMGVVYSAYDPDLDRKVALKLVRVGDTGSLTSSQATQAAQEGLVREARAMARLSHPNVVSVYDVGVHGRDVFVAMELVEGTTLRRWLRAEKRAVSEILDVFVQAGRGLDAAHQVGIVHRDFKPSNVLVGDDGLTRVMDFGLAGQSERERRRQDRRDADAGSGSSAQSTHSLGTRGLMGTPAYMPPEQYESPDVDARADQYSFCVTLFEALYETRPFTAAPGLSLRDAKLRGVPDSVPHRLERAVPRRVRHALARGLSPDPAQRWASMVPLMRTLEPLRRGRWVAATVGTVGVAAAVAGAAVAYANHAEERAALCSGGPARMDAIWNAEIKARIRGAFHAVDVPYAATAWEKVEPELDARTIEWADMYRGACEATQIRKEQTAEIMHARMVCFDRVRLDLQALARVFAEADEKVVEKAINAVGALPSVAHCGDLSALETPNDRPSDPEV